MTTATINPGPASVASARDARGSLGWPCARVPWAAWVLAKRTGCTSLFTIFMSNSGRSNGSFYPARPYEEVEKPVRAVRFPVFHAGHDVVANGRACVVRANGVVPSQRHRRGHSTMSRTGPPRGSNGAAITVPYCHPNDPRWTCLLLQHQFPSQSLCPSSRSHRYTNSQFRSNSHAPIQYANFTGHAC